MNIFLIGYRCTGKTSVGKSLSKKLMWSFVDADAEVVNTCGISISEMVSRYGWDFFREQERESIKRLSLLDCHVVAAGGGVVLNPENVKDMKQNGIIIWLKAKPEIILQRMLQDETTKTQRPALTSKGLLEEINETLLFRTPLYETAMNFSIDTDGLCIDDICNEIVLTAKNYGLKI